MSSPHGELERLLEAGLAEIGYEPTSDRLRRLTRYLDEIELWNPRLKLVAASGRELVVRHLLDCLAGASAIVGPSGPIVAGARRIADLGSGAGLPGIPVAIVHPEISVDLVERSGRRAGFLRNAIAATRCSNATVHETDASAYRGPADVVTFRAFAPLTPQLVRSMRSALRAGGVICAFKGRESAISAELSQLGEPEARVVPVVVPFLHEERHILVL